MSDNVLNFNFADIDTSGGDYEALPVGRYQADISALEFRRSSLKGTPGINVTLTVTGPSYAGRKIWDDFWLTAASAWKIKILLEKATRSPYEKTWDYDLSDQNDINDLMEEMSSTLLNKNVTITLGQESYTAKTGEEKIKNVVTKYDVGTDSVMTGVPF